MSIVNRANYGDRLKNFDVRIGMDKNNYRNNPTCFDRVSAVPPNEGWPIQCNPPVPGRYVRVQMFGTGILTMCEVLVYSRLGKLVLKCFSLKLVGIAWECLILMF